MNHQYAQPEPYAGTIWYERTDNTGTSWRVRCDICKRNIRPAEPLSIMETEADAMFVGVEHDGFFHPELFGEPSEYFRKRVTGVRAAIVSIQTDDIGDDSWTVSCVVCSNYQATREQPL